MNILEKIEYALYDGKESLVESGIRNIRALAKTHKEAEVYFHQDLDGVCSAIAIKNYLERYGIKVIDTHVIQYGDKEYAVPKPKTHTLHVLVDFAHGKDAVMHIHTDHHEGQVGVAKGTSTSFVHTPSNAAYLSAVIPQNDAFPQEDLKLISMVDSADFANNNITPDDVMRAAFKLNKDLDVSRNRTFMGLVCNKLILAYKNKPQFMEKLVMMAKPSLISMYNITKYLAKQGGYRPPEELQAAMDNYVEIQKEKASDSTNLRDIKTMKTGVSMEFGPVVVQYGSSSLVSQKVVYDRYTVFKVHPDSLFLVIMWPLGLLQATRNPFKKNVPNIHLGDLARSILERKYKSKLQNIEVSLEYIKRTFEKKAIDDSLGFGFNDFLALFKEYAKGLDGSQKWAEIVSDITNKKYDDLSDKQKNVLKKITVTAWDVINAQSGGHPAITNISGLNFIGRGYVDIMKEMAMDVVKELSEIRS